MMRSVEVVISVKNRVIRLVIVLKKRHLEKKLKDKNYSHVSEKVQKDKSDNVELFNIKCLTVSELNACDMWYADSAATEHLCMRRDWFKKLKSFQNHEHEVRVGNGNLVAAVGVGDIDVKVKRSDGTFNTYTICDV